MTNQVLAQLNLIATAEQSPNASTSQPVSAPTPPDISPVPIDPTNPLAWILVVSLLLSNTDEVIEAIVHLLEVLKGKQKDDR